MIKMLNSGKLNMCCPSHDKTCSGRHEQCAGLPQLAKITGKNNEKTIVKKIIFSIPPSVLLV